MNPIFVYAVWSIIAIASLTSTVFLILAMNRIRSLMTRLEDTAQFLKKSEPKISGILDGVDAGLVELRLLSEKANRIAGSAESVTSDLRIAVRPIIAEVSDLGQSVRHVRAAAVAVQAGLSAWWDHRRVPNTVNVPGNGHSEER